MHVYRGERYCGDGGAQSLDVFFPPPHVYNGLSINNVIFYANGCARLLQNCLPRRVGK